MHGEASAKAELYKDRFLLLFQRVCRDGHFSTSAFNAQTSEFGSCEVVLQSVCVYASCLVCKIYLT